MCREVGVEFGAEELKWPAVELIIFCNFSVNCELGKYVRTSQ
jgi:hypothetical protein